MAHHRRPRLRFHHHHHRHRPHVPLKTPCHQDQRATPATQHPTISIAHITLTNPKTPWRATTAATAINLTFTINATNDWISDPTNEYVAFAVTAAFASALFTLVGLASLAALIAKRHAFQRLEAPIQWALAPPILIIQTPRIAVSVAAQI